MHASARAGGRQRPWSDCVIWSGLRPRKPTPSLASTAPRRSKKMRSGVKRRKTGGGARASLPLPAEKAAAPSSVDVPASKVARKQEQCEEACIWEGCPVEVLQVIGSHLSPSDLCNARLTCRLWATHITEAVESVNVQLHPDPLVARQKLQHLKKLTPLARAWHLNLSGRLSQSTFDDYIRQLGPLKKLRELHLQFLTVIDPKWPTAGQRVCQYSSLSCLKDLQSLTITDGPVPKENSLQALTSLTGLTRLCIRSPMYEANGRAMMDDDHHISNQQASLAMLSSLRELEYPIAGSSVAVSHMTLAALTRLTSLAITGSSLMSNPLTNILKISSLQHVDVGVCCHASLRSLGFDKARELGRIGLRLDARTSLPDDLMLLNTRLQGKVERLAVSGLLLDASHIEALAACTSLRALEITDPRTYAAAPNEAGAGAGAPPSAVCLRPLTSLTALTSFTYNKAATEAVMPHSLGLRSGLARLAAAWAPTLRKLDLSGLTSDDFTAGAAAALGRLAHLQDLTVRGSEHSSQLLPVDMESLPTSLESLTLRYAHLSCPTGGHGRLVKLLHLSLSHCSTACLPHFQAAMDGLQGLRSLELEDCIGLSNAHLAALSSLTALTSLGMSAISNHHVTNSALGGLTGLRELRRLKWHAGDMLDSILDPGALKCFPNLFQLSITTSMYYRMSRWSALNVLEMLPYCQLEATGL